MSGIWSYFGGGAAQKRKEAPREAILGLRTQLDMLQKRERHLENQAADQLAIAKKNATANPTAAKTALKRKKQIEHSLDQTSAQVSTLEQQIYSIEAANINRETLQAMQKAGKAMEQIHSGLTMDKVDKTMEKLREHHELGEEIAQQMTTMPIGPQVDDEDLEAELEDLQQEEIDSKMTNTGTIPVSDEVNSLPAAANNPIKDKQASREEEDEEAELAKLQAEMAA
ncbi:MAG: ESCRT-III subunit protein snf7 [Vezdaea aestivalis]|nr:MAG: ESCRT-III subunit protein snf7 [Vezdaea aestivalis]